MQAPRTQSLSINIQAHTTSYVYSILFLRTGISTATAMEEEGRRVLPRTGYPRRRAVAACLTCREKKRKWYVFSNQTFIYTLQTLSFS